MPVDKNNSETAWKATYTIVIRANGPYILFFYLQIVIYLIH